MAEPLERAASKLLADLIQIFPVVIVNGPRRTGKSTLVRKLAPTAGWPYRSLDDLPNRTLALEHPDQFASAHIPAVIDEVQRAPDLLIAVKSVVDRAIPPEAGQFVLTGSVDLLQHPAITESLAGRAGYIRLGPLTRRERHGIPGFGRWSMFFDDKPNAWVAALGREPGPKEAWRTAAELGGLPPVALARSAEERLRVLDAYVATYIETDLRDLAQIDQLPDFRRLMRGAALRTGNLLNIAELARDIQVPATTVTRWLRLLEVSYLLHRVEAFTVNRTSRLLKTPKLFWADTALALFVAGAPQPTGAHLENLVLADLLVWREFLSPRPTIMHWRAANGREVDFVVERGNRVLAVEVKATTKPSPRDWKNLLSFIDEYSDLAVGALLLHDGDDTVMLTDRLLATPWWTVL